MRTWSSESKRRRRGDVETMGTQPARDYVERLRRDYVTEMLSKSVNHLWPKGFQIADFLEFFQMEHSTAIQHGPTTRRGRQHGWSCWGGGPSTILKHIQYIHISHIV